MSEAAGEVATCGMNLPDDEEPNAGDKRFTDQQAKVLKLNERAAAESTSRCCHITAN